jgi:hypothetical protein
MKSVGVVNTHVLTPDAATPQRYRIFPNIDGIRFLLHEGGRGEIHTKAEGNGQEDFISWKRGISLYSPRARFRAN